jgi:N-acyl-D-amino-acid deacylase
MTHPPRLALTGATVYDGTGADGRDQTVLLDAGRIEGLLDGRAPVPNGYERIALDGLAVAPGFIDTHAHGDLEPLALPGAESKLACGVTTELCGNCGSTPFPLAGRVPGYLREKGERLGVTVDWQSAEEYFQRLEAAGSAVNRLFLVGHGRLRANVCGAEARPAHSQEIAQMAAALEEALAAGAWGLSTGLMYPPGCHAHHAELELLTPLVGQAGGLYTTHLRSEGEGVLEAIEEAAGIAQAGGAHLQISHLKLSGEANWAKLEAMKTLLEQLRGDGLHLGADWYPYESWNANLDALLPNWVYEGGTMRLLSRLRDPAMRHRLADQILDLAREGVSWQSVRIGTVRLPENARFQGRSIAEVSEELGLSPEDTLFNLILAEGGRAEGFVESMSRQVQAAILDLDFVAIGTDATARAFEGPTVDGFPHPRTYGTHPRVLRLAREEGLLSLPEAIRRMTSLPAAQIGLADRGRVAPGQAADLTVFDPATVRDRASYQQPIRRPEGIVHVLVGGVFALRDSEPTGARTGRLLRRTSALRPAER